jgi:hypothetical protein
MKKLAIILVAGLVALSACGKSKAKLLDNKDDNIIIAENSWMDKAKEYLSEYKPIALVGVVVILAVVGCGILGYLGNGSKNPSTDTDSSTVNSSTVNSSTVNSSTVNSSTVNSSTVNSSTVNSSTY